MAKVHVVLNRKGGVGKSTLVVNLSAVTADVLSRKKIVPAAARTLAGTADDHSAVVAVSVDPQGSAVWWSERVEELPFAFVQAHDDLEGLAGLRELPGVRHVFVDTPGWMDLKDGMDPLGRGSAAEVLRIILDCAHDVIVPVNPAPLCFDPTWDTIERVIKPRGLPYSVVINNWDPRDGTTDLEQTREFVLANGWPLANTVVRRYKLHERAAADGLVCTQYPSNRTAANAREDFFRLALEAGLDAADRLAEISAETARLPEVETV